MRPPARSRHNRKVIDDEDSKLATRQRILHAATVLFAVRGAAGTTIRQIADAAGMNSQLIYYYFGDKTGLFHAALEAAAGRVDALLAQVTNGEGSLRERLYRFIGDWVSVTLAEAPTIRMLHRAVLEGDEQIVEAVRGYSSRHSTTIVALITEGIAGGTFRSDVDPRAAVASLGGMVNYLALVDSIIFRSTMLDSNMEDIARHTAELFLRGLDARND